MEVDDKSNLYYTLLALYKQTFTSNRLKLFTVTLKIYQFDMFDECKLENIFSNWYFERTRFLEICTVKNDNNCYKDPRRMTTFKCLMLT